MRPYTKILVWENNRRLKKLAEFRELVINYFQHSQYQQPLGVDPRRVEEEAAIEARIYINRIMVEIHDIIRHSRINPILTYTPPPAVGGYVQQVDVIHNIFFLDRFGMGVKEVLDFVDRVIGIYESNHRASLFRIYNPFFYLGILSDVISDFPFIALSKLGYDREKAESSTLGRLLKGVLYLIAALIAFLAAFLTILQLLDFLEPVKQFARELLGFNVTN